MAEIGEIGEIVEMAPFICPFAGARKLLFYDKEICDFADIFKSHKLACQQKSTFSMFEILSILHCLGPLNNWYRLIGYPGTIL